MKLQRKQYDDIFSQLIVPNFFNRIIELLDSLGGLCQSVCVERRKKKNSARYRDARKGYLHIYLVIDSDKSRHHHHGRRRRRHVCVYACVCVYE